MKVHSILYLLLFLTSCTVGQDENAISETNDPMAYFGQKEPSTTPELFAANIISKPDRHEFGCTFSKTGKEFYYGVDNDGKSEIYYSNLIDGTWTPSKKLFESDSIGYNDPMLSPDDKRLYFISDRPIDNTHEKNDIDIWYVERANIKTEWSEPINLGVPINTERNEYYSSFTDDGTIYFSSRDQSEDAPRYAFDIYRSEFKNGQFLSPEKLPETINTNRYETDVFIAPDESYMIFCSIRRNGLGQGDLYISFRDKLGIWSEVTNMGELINTDKHELCPFCLLYTSPSPRDRG